MTLAVTMKPALPSLDCLYYPFKDSSTLQAHAVGRCHHGMARPQVADRVTASDMEGGCE